MEFNWSPDNSIVGGMEALVAGAFGVGGAASSLRLQPDSKIPAAKTVMAATTAATVAPVQNRIQAGCPEYDSPSVRCALILCQVKPDVPGF
jgi:hypothetical protein